MIKFSIYDKQKKEPILMQDGLFTFEELIKAGHRFLASGIDALVGEKNGVVTIFQNWPTTKSNNGLDHYSDDEALAILTASINAPQPEPTPDMIPATQADIERIEQNQAVLEIQSYLTEALLEEVLSKIGGNNNV